MPYHPSPHQVGAVELASERALAHAVVEQALRDAWSAHADRRTEARAFLADPESLAWWCLLLDVPVSAVLAYAQRVLAQG